MKLRELEEKLEKVTTEAVKVKSLKEQLEKLETSSVLDKQSALDNLTLELQHKYEEEIKTLRSSHEAELLKLRLAHETEMSKLKSAHDEQVAILSGSKLREEIREIKAGFEKDKTVATAQKE